MLHEFDHLKGMKILSRDGEDAGKTKDLYFDDREWAVRYLVVESGGWLSGRKVLLSPESFFSPDWKGKKMPVNLSLEQIRESPDVSLDQPVSRQEETRLTKHYGWRSPHWYWLPAEPPYQPPPFPEGIPEVPKEPRTTAPEADRTPSLRSAKEISRYHVYGTDEEIGSVKEILVDDQDWIIRYLVAETGGWFSGRRVLVPPVVISGITYSDRRIQVRLSRSEVEKSPEFDPDLPVERDYEARLYDHYGWPKYWI